MMAIGEEFVVICLDTIDDQHERTAVVNHLKASHKTIIEITEKQMHQFAGNMLQVYGANAKRFTVMSTCAFNSLTAAQINQFEQYGGIIHSDLNTIETCGGGSARCMMAEVFLPRT